MRTPSTATNHTRLVPVHSPSHPRQSKSPINRTCLAALCAGFGAFSPLLPARATDYVICDRTETNPITLLDGDTLTICPTGKLLVSSGAYAVDMAGSSTITVEAQSATVKGELRHTGSGRAIRCLANNESLVINNSGIISAAANDAIKVSVGGTAICDGRH